MELEKYIIYSGNGTIRSLLNQINADTIIKKKLNYLETLRVWTAETLSLLQLKN